MNPYRDSLVFHATRWSNAVAEAERRGRWAAVIAFALGVLVTAGVAMVMR
jgi:hypothetical protein